MLLLQDAVSTWVLVYFLLLIIFGSFFLVNLALAVLYLQFTKEFSLTPAASQATSRAASTAATRCNSYAAAKPGPRMQQLQEGLQRAWPQGEEERVWPGSLSGSGVLADQCPKQQQECGGHGAYAHRSHHQQGIELGPTSAGGVQQHSAVRQAPQCEEGLGEHLGPSCDSVRVPGGLEQLPAAVPPKRLPPLAGSTRVTQVTGEVSFACDAGSLPGSWSGSGEGLRTTQDSTAEQDFVTARVIVSRRTNSTKTAHWASLEQPHAPALHHPSREAALHHTPRAIIKPAQQQQQQQPVGPADSTGRWQHLFSCLQGCWAPFNNGWGLLRQMCRQLVKVSRCQGTPVASSSLLRVS